MTNYCGGYDLCCLFGWNCFEKCLLHGKECCFWCLVLYYSTFHNILSRATTRRVINLVPMVYRVY